MDQRDSLIDDMAHELDVLVEWERVQRELNGLLVEVWWTSGHTWGQQIEELVQRLTHGRARLELHGAEAEANGVDGRSAPVAYGRTWYGYVRVRGDYLRSERVPDLAEELGRRIGMLLGQVETLALLQPRLERLEAMDDDVSLTPCEMEVLLGLARGETPEESASRRGTSEATERSHRQHLYCKLGVHGGEDAVLRASVLGKIDWLKMETRSMPPLPRRREPGRETEPHRRQRRRPAGG